jgi:hypothetical protein
MKVLYGECIGDEDGVSFSSQFLSDNFYSDKYLAILHTTYILHMHKKKMLAFRKVSVIFVLF